MRCTILCRPRLSQEPRPPSAGQIGEHDTIDAKRNALVVIGVQNYFVAEDFPLEVPVAREIVLHQPSRDGDAQRGWTGGVGSDHGHRWPWNVAQSEFSGSFLYCGLELPYFADI
jgi:hypothetical protein